MSLNEISELSVGKNESITSITYDFKNNDEIKVTFAKLNFVDILHTSAFISYTQM